MTMRAARLSGSSEFRILSRRTHPDNITCQHFGSARSCFCYRSSRPHRSPRSRAAFRHRLGPAQR